MSKYAPHSSRLSQPKASPSTVCQKCLERGKCGQFAKVITFGLRIGHYTYECKNTRPYVSRPSRTQQLENPKLQEKLRVAVEVPDEFTKKPCVSFFKDCDLHCILFYRTGLAARILEDKEKARSKLSAGNEGVGEVMDSIRKRKKEQKEKSVSSKKRRYVDCPLFRFHPLCNRQQEVPIKFEQWFRQRLIKFNF